MTDRQLIGISGRRQSSGLGVLLAGERPFRGVFFWASSFNGSAVACQRQRGGGEIFALAFFGSGPVNYYTGYYCTAYLLNILYAVLR